jgi:4-hydroxybenzoate polyprenyltransferase
MTERNTSSGLRARATRIRLYLAEMFPPQLMGTFAALHFLAIWFSLQALGGLRPLRLTWTSMRGVATVVLFLLLMRTYDELKDLKTDLALGRAGDPLYRDRVLVTGAVRPDDVRALRWVVTLALIALNLQPWPAWSSLAFWILFGVTWLSFHWFFWSKVSRNLLLAFVTHNPISLLLGAYVVALFADEFGLSRVSTSAIPLLLGLWMPLAAWETSRKIRVPEDETTYQTYSRLLGWRVAAALPAAFVTAAAVCLLWVGKAAGLGNALPVLIGAAWAVVVARCALFRFAPSRRRANLKPWAMLFAAVSNAGLAIAAGVSKGVIW